VQEQSSLIYGYKAPATTNAYTYDGNGNLQTDAAKNMFVDYNYLNLPERIEFDSCKFVEIQYDAAGMKLSKITKAGAIQITRQDYIGGIEYRNGELEAVYHEEGRVYFEEGTSRYEYTMRDHQGNTRVTFTDKDGDGLIEVTAKIILSSLLTLLRKRVHMILHNRETREVSIINDAATDMIGIDTGLDLVFLAQGSQPLPKNRNPGIRII
jgi:hypothetical protein